VPQREESGAVVIKVFPGEQRSLVEWWLVLDLASIVVRVFAEAVRAGMPLEARAVGKLAVRVSMPNGVTVYKISRLLYPLGDTDRRAIALSTIGGGENIVVAELDEDERIASIYPDRIPWVLAAAELVSRYEADAWARRIRFFRGDRLEPIERLDTIHSVYGVENRLELAVVNEEHRVVVTWYNCLTSSILSPVEWQARMGLIDSETARVEREKIGVYVGVLKKKCGFSLG
jgi:hypothetical protein